VVPAYHVVALEANADLPKVVAFRDWVFGEARRERDGA
jgi:hypothetical protein